MSVSGGQFDATLAIVRGSGVDPLPFRLVSASDHASPITGASPSVVLSKNAQTFAAPAGQILEIGHGSYYVSPSTGDTDTLGPMILVASAGGADTYRALINVIPEAGIAPIPVGISTYPLVVFLGTPGLSPSVQLSKAGAAFGSAIGVPIREVGGPGNGLGFYSTTPNSNDTGTPGALLLSATATNGPNTYYGYSTYDVTGIRPIPGRLALTMLAIRAMIVNSGLFPLPACVISQEQEPFPSPSPPCCWLSIGDFPIDNPIESGVGRYNPIVEGEIVSNIVLRRTRDIDQQDTQLLTNAAGGLPLVDQLINVLLEQFPLDDSGNALTSCGLKLAGIGRAHSYSRDKMLAVIPVRWRVRIMLMMNVP